MSFIAKSLLAVLASLFAVMVLPDYSYTNTESHQVFSLQLASFPSLGDAKEEVSELTCILSDEQLNHLRIEKVGKYYTLRLGVFDTFASAQQYGNSINSAASPFIVVKTRFIRERIVKSYQSSLGTTGSLEPKHSSGKTSSGEARPGNSASIDEGKTRKKRAPEAAKPQNKALKLPQEKPRPDQRNQEPAAKDYPPPTLQASASSIALSGLRKSDLSPKAIPIENIITTLSTLYQIGDYGKALDIAREEMNNNPLHHKLNAWYGALLLKNSKPALAVAYLQQAAQLSPDEPDYHSSLGYCFLYLSRYEKARLAFQTALSLDPRHIDALSGLGMVLKLSGEKEKAMGIYNRLSSIDKESAAMLLKVINRNI